MRASTISLLVLFAAVHAHAALNRFLRPRFFISSGARKKFTYFPTPPASTQSETKNICGHSTRPRETHLSDYSAIRGTGSKDFSMLLSHSACQVLACCFEVKVTSLFCF
jgi:hypothetical protein